MEDKSVEKRRKNVLLISIGRAQEKKSGCIGFVPAYFYRYLLSLTVSARFPFMGPASKNE